MAGAAALTLRATRRLNSGLSMVTRQSGLAAAIGARGLADPPQQPRQVADDGAETHQRDLGGIEQAVQPLALQMMAADADELDRPSAHRAKRANEIGAEQIAGFLAGDNGDAQRRAARRSRAVLPAGRRRRGPSALASAQHRLIVEDQRAAGLDADAGEPGLVRRGDRLRSDRRHVGAQFLSRLGAFDDDAALLAGEPSVRTQRPWCGPAGRRFLRRPPAR